MALIFKCKPYVEPINRSIDVKIIKNEALILLCYESSDNNLKRVLYYKPQKEAFDLRRWCVLSKCTVFIPDRNLR